MSAIWLAPAFLGGVVVGLLLAGIGVAWIGHIFARATVQGS